ncbi:MAG: regulatory iron-sulfur-containing complex subunit RicT [Chloroflexota bacterium]|nr:regulatory iron-sulfur-containing complex subunit RicT [Chloroflexota bacterium]
MASLERTVASIRFQPVGKIYHFDASKIDDLKAGDYVIVSTSRGRELGEVAGLLGGEKAPKGSYKPVVRRASPRELVMRRMWQSRELEATINCREKAHELGVTGIKIVRAEYCYDGSRLTFITSSEGDESIDLTPLKRAMRRSIRKTQIEFRKVGPRDVAKIICGMGACGLEERCCSRFLSEFSPISIKMAKAQGISLNPQEITGMCGRLRCCLIYEYELYAEARKHLPKRKKKVVTPRGVGKVIDVLPLKNTVVVKLDDERRVEFHKDEIQPYDELKALQEKAESPCDKNENGEGNRGKKSS